LKLGLVNRVVPGAQLESGGEEVLQQSWPQSAHCHARCQQTLFGSEKDVLGKALEQRCSIR